MILHNRIESCECHPADKTTALPRKIMGIQNELDKIVYKENSMQLSVEFCIYGETTPKEKYKITI